MRFVLLLLFCSAFRVLAVCCCASFCAAAGDDLLRSCHKRFCKCNLVDVNNTHTYSGSYGVVQPGYDVWGGCAPVSYTHLRAHETG